ncbi:MAG: hypothetical protein BWX65_00550 [Bacteroidetes bacterium ADurb.Bin057]|nr:MAG: hypothetical protein BWX65_00550 [Bacteroidetes bacterium ADurb.Bin057]
MSSITIGSMAFVGSLLFAAAILQRITSQCCVISFSGTVNFNNTDTLEIFAIDVDCISAMPSMLRSSFSITLVTCSSTSCADAPG